MRINIYKYTDQVGQDCIGAKLIKTVEVEVFPRNQTEFATDNGGDFLEIEETDDVLHWTGTLQEDRQRHLRELFAEGVEEPRCDS